MADPVPKQDSRMAVQLTVEELRQVVREELKAALNGNGNGRIADKEWLKAKELAELYGKPKTWFEERGRAGDIARNKSGRHVIFKKADVEAYLEQHLKKEPIVRKKRRKENVIDNASEV